MCWQLIYGSEIFVSPGGCLSIIGNRTRGKYDGVNMLHTKIKKELRILGSIRMLFLCC
jgi:hypothetical protein